MIRRLLEWIRRRKVAPERPTLGRQPPTAKTAGIVSVDVHVIRNNGDVEHVESYGTKVGGKWLRTRQPA